MASFLYEENVQATFDILGLKTLITPYFKVKGLKWVISQKTTYILIARV